MTRKSLIGNVHLAFLCTNENLIFSRRERLAQPAALSRSFLQKNEAKLKLASLRENEFQFPLFFRQIFNVKFEFLVNWRVLRVWTQEMLWKLLKNKKEKSFLEGTFANTYVKSKFSTSQIYFVNSKEIIEIRPIHYLTVHKDVIHLSIFEELHRLKAFRD